MRLPDAVEDNMIKKPYIAVSVIFSLITFFIPLIASLLDWLDLDRAKNMERKLSIQQRKIHSKVLDI